VVTENAEFISFGLMLVLLGIAGFALAAGIVTPTPERVRRRSRRR
jgi:hypothetical protein